MKKTVSVADIMEKARKGETLSVVFFGGSLTWGANSSNPNVTSWRGRTMQMLQKRYPQAHWTFTDAAIGGTGSTLGIFRLERDVFRRNPDLVILDFTLNDGLQGSREGFHDTANQSYEGILRACLERNVAVLPVFFASKGHTENRDIAVLKRRLQHMELFNKYQLEYADVLKLLNDDYKAGKLNTDELWPPEVFDRVHPHDAGYAAYAACFNREWERIENAPVKRPILHREALCGDTFQYFRRFDLAELNRPGWVPGFSYPVADCFDWLSSRWLDKVVTCGNAERISVNKWKSNGNKAEPFQFKFRAEQIALMMEVIPESVPFSVSIDGEAPRSIKFREVQSSQFHFVTLGSNLDPDKIHTITVYPQQKTADRPAVMRWGSILLNSSKPVELEW